MSDALDALPSGRAVYTPTVLFLFQFTLGMGAAMWLVLTDGTAPLTAMAEAVLSDGGRSGGISVLEYTPVLAAAFLSTSSLGFLILPLIFFVRGFQLTSGTVGMLLAGVPFARTVLVLLLPALLSLFGLTLLCEDAFFASRLPLLRFRFVSAGRLAVCVSLITASLLLRGALMDVIL